MADTVKELIVKLSADNADLKKKLGEGKKEVDGFGNNIKALAGKLAGFAAAAGIGVSAMAALKGIIKSTNAISDKFEKTTTQGAFAMKKFFQVVATGEWTGLIQGLRDAVEMGGKYAEILDRLEDETRAQQILDAQSRAEMSGLMIQMRNRNLSDTERIAITERIIAIEKRNANERKRIAQETLDVKLNAASVSSGLRSEQIQDLLTNYKQNEAVLQLAQAYNNAKDAVDGYGAIQAQTRSRIRSKDDIAKETEQISKYKQEVESASEGVKLWAQVLKGFNKLGPETRAELAGAISEVSNKTTEYNETLMRTFTMRNSLMAQQSNTNEELIREKNSWEEAGKGINIYNQMLQMRGKGGADVTAPGMPTTPGGGNMGLPKTTYVDALTDSFSALGKAMQESSINGARSFADMANAGVEAARQIIAANLARAISESIASSLVGVPSPLNIVIAGLAAGAVTTMFNSLIPSFAGGGYIASPTLAMIGDAPGGEYVLNASQMASMTRNVQVTGIIRGRDIYLTNNKAGREAARY